MATCTAGTNDEARIERAARSLRLRCPMAAVDTIPPAESRHDCWTVEATVAEMTSAPDYAYAVFADEGLDLEVAQARGPHFELVATA